MSKTKAVAVFREGKQHGVILAEDVADFVNSLFTQPEGANITLVRTDVDRHLIGSPITKRAKQIDKLVGENGE